MEKQKTLKYKIGLHLNTGKSKHALHFSKEEPVYSKVIDKETGEVTGKITGKKNTYEEIQAERENCQELKDCFEVMEGNQLAPKGGTDKLRFRNVSKAATTYAEAKEIYDTSQEAKDTLNQIKDQLAADKAKGFFVKKPKEPVKPKEPKKEDK